MQAGVAKSNLTEKKKQHQFTVAAINTYERKGKRAKKI